MNETVFIYSNIRLRHPAAPNGQNRALNRDQSLRFLGFLGLTGLLDSGAAIVESVQQQMHDPVQFSLELVEAEFRPELRVNKFHRRRLDHLGRKDDVFNDELAA